MRVNPYGEISGFSALDAEEVLFVNGGGGQLEGLPRSQMSSQAAAKMVASSAAQAVISAAKTVVKAIGTLAIGIVIGSLPVALSLCFPDQKLY